ncbi:MAG: hypothetical protein ACI857_002390 [Arenicella sp.]|jgi:hypothetical protein
MISKLLHKSRFPLLTFALSFVVLFYFFHTVLLSPNEYLFSPGGDGIKNYYTYLFHAKHDVSFWEFTGMNYPYYENIVFTDAHPLLSSIIGYLGLADYGIGILNLLMLVAFPLCSVFLYLIFRNYKVEVLWSIAAAVALTYMAPQIGRITGHFSLSYLFAIPAMWYILIQCNNARHATIWAIISFLFVFAFFFTHPYLGIIIAFLCLFFWLINYLANKAQWKSAMGFTTVQVIIPFVLFRLLIFGTDDHYNRMDTPGGFFHLHGEWGSVLMPHHGPIHEALRTMTDYQPHWESWSYLGLSTILMFGFVVVYAIIKRKELPFKLIMKKELFLFVIAAYLILLFSFCFPFKFDFMKWTTDLIGPLKQFRVLGRFAWIFFFVFSVATIVAFYNIYKKQGKNMILGGCFVFAIGFYFIEAHEHISGVAEACSQSKNEFNESELNNDLRDLVAHLEAEKYDAFIMLPFTHMSSENMMLLGEEQANYDSFMISYHTGLPMLNSVSSRLSQDECVKFNNFFGPEFCDKKLLKDIPGNAKIAVITNQDNLSLDELQFMWTQEYTYQNEVFSVCEFDREAYNNPFYFEKIMEELKTQSDCGKNEFTSQNPNEWFFYNSWDDQKGESLKGKGSLQGVKKGYDLLWESSTDDLENTDYTVSYWFNHKVDRADLSSIVELTYKDGSKGEWVSRFDLKQSTQIVGHWLQVEMNFTINPNVEGVKVFLCGNDSEEPYIIDELLVRKTNGANLFNHGQIGGEQFIIFNNNWISEDSFSE